MSKIKETDYFQHNYDKGLVWFQSLFDHWAGEHAVGEASPGNMACCEAPARMTLHMPDGKLIFMLRNPIERAYSQY